MKPLLLSFTSVCLLLSTVFGYKYWESNDRQQKTVTQLATLQKHQQTLAQEIKTLRARTEEIQVRTEKTRQEIAARATKAREQDNKREAIFKELLEINTAFAKQEKLNQKDPGYYQRLSLSRRLQLKQECAAFLRTSGLNQEQQEAFMALIMRDDLRKNDIINTALQNGIAMNDPIVGKVVGESYLETDRELVSQFGQELRDQFRNSERRNAVDSLVDKLNARSLINETPLSSAQSEQLTRVLLDASPSYAQGKTCFLIGLDWEKVTTQARDILTPAQWISSGFAEESANWKYNQLFNEAVSKDLLGGKKK